MHQDFAKISAMLREARMITQETLLDTVKIVQIDGDDKPASHPVVIEDNSPIIDQIFKIAESHK